MVSQVKEINEILLDILDVKMFSLNSRTRRAGHCIKELDWPEDLSLFGVILGRLWLLFCILQTSYYIQSKILSFVLDVLSSSYSESFKLQRNKFN